MPQQTEAEAARKLEYQRRAEVLRAKLVAMRQNTPVAKARTPTPKVDTPTKQSPAASPPAPHQQAEQQEEQQQEQQEKQQEEDPEDQKEEGEVDEDEGEIPDIDALLAAGKAAADAQIAALNVNGTKTAPNKAHVEASTVNGHGTKSNHTQQQKTVARRGSDQHYQDTTSQHTPLTTTSSTDLSDAYYTDLAAWLEMTGYHDVEYRNARLRTHKQRQKLEEEAARIAEKLERLKQAEQAEMQQIRLSTPNFRASSMAPPPLPKSLPQQTNGVKRGRCYN